MCTIIKSYPNPMTLRGQIRKYWGSVEATNHINDVTSMKDRLDVTRYILYHQISISDTELF